MLFPEEIFKMIMKKHKINYLEEKLSLIFNHEIEIYEYNQEQFRNELLMTRIEEILEGTSISF